MELLDLSIPLHTTGLAGIDADLRQVETRLGRTDAVATNALAAMGRNATAAGAGVTDLGAAVSALGGRLPTLSTGTPALVTLGRATATAAAGVAELAGQAQGLGAVVPAVQGAGRSMTALGGAAAAAGDDVASLTESTTNLDDELAAVTPSADAVAVALDGIDNSVQTLRADFQAGLISAEIFEQELARLRQEAIALRTQSGALGTRELPVFTRVLAQTAPEAGRATAGMQRVQRSVIAVGLAMAGVQGPAGALARTLLTFGAGGLVGAAFAVGAGLIGQLIDRITASSRRAKQALDEAKKTLDAWLNAQDPRLAALTEEGRRIEQLRAAELALDAARSALVAEGVRPSATAEEARLARIAALELRRGKLVAERVALEQQRVRGGTALEAEQRLKQLDREIAALTTIAGIRELTNDEIDRGRTLLSEVAHVIEGSRGELEIQAQWLDRQDSLTKALAAGSERRREALEREVGELQAIAELQGLSPSQLDRARAINEQITRELKRQKDNATEQVRLLQLRNSLAATFAATARRTATEGVGIRGGFGAPPIAPEREPEAPAVPRRRGVIAAPAVPEFPVFGASGDETAQFFGGFNIDTSFLEEAVAESGARLRIAVAAEYDATEALLQELNASLGDTLQTGLTSALTGIAEAVGNALGSGENAFAAFGKALLAGLGGLIADMGAVLIAFGVQLVLLQKALTNPLTAGPAMIAIGAVMVALGSALRAVSARHVGGRGGGGGGATPFNDETTNVTIVQGGQTATAVAAASRITPKAPVTINATIIGARDPAIGRELAEMVDAANRRGVR